MKGNEDSTQELRKLQTEDHEYLISLFDQARGTNPENTDNRFTDCDLADIDQIFQEKAKDNTGNYDQESDARYFSGNVGAQRLIDNNHQVMLSFLSTTLPETVAQYTKEMIKDGDFSETKFRVDLYPLSLSIDEELSIINIGYQPKDDTLISRVGFNMKEGFILGDLSVNKKDAKFSLFPMIMSDEAKRRYKPIPTSELADFAVQYIISELKQHGVTHQVEVEKVKLQNMSGYGVLIKTEKLRKPNMFAECLDRIAYLG